MLPAVLFLAHGLAVSAAPAAVPLTPADERMNRPVPPFRIAGNLYYVGANDVTSFLVATKDGLVLLDSGFAETVPQIERNVEALGFHLADVKRLIVSHAHYDHAGGLAALKRKTGAPLWASRGDRPQLEDGGLHDPAFGSRFRFEPVKVDRLVADGDTLELGGTRLVAHLTPGHTPGCTTFSTRVEEDGKPLDVVFLCSVSSPGYRLVGKDAVSPGIADRFRRSLEILRKLPCDVLLGAHGNFFDLEGKRAKLAAAAASNPFIDRTELPRFVAKRAEELEREVAKQERDAR